MRELEKLPADIQVIVLPGNHDAVRLMEPQLPLPARVQEGYPPGVVFTYRPSRAGVNAEQILQGFDGILQLDGYPGYDRLTRPSRKGGAPITVAHCWAHARRKLKEVFDRDGSEIAAEGLRRIAEFYRIETEIRGMGPGQRLSARQTRTAPLVAEFGLRFCFVFLTIAALSFLGVGIQPPTADWGSMVRANASLIQFAKYDMTAAITPLLPAAAIALLTVAVNFIVDWFLHKTSGLRE